MTEEGHGRYCLQAVIRAVGRERLGRKEESHQMKRAESDPGFERENHDFFKPHRSEKMMTYRQPAKPGLQFCPLGTSRHQLPLFSCNKRINKNTHDPSIPARLLK